MEEKFIAIREKIINKYAIKGFKNMDRAEAEVLISLVKQGIIRYNSIMEMNVAKNIESYTSSDDDIIFYNEKTFEIIEEKATIENNKIVKYNTVIIHK